MKNTSLFRRVLSVVLTIAMLFTLVVPAVSAEQSKGSTIEELTLTPVDRSELGQSKAENKVEDSSDAQKDHAPDELVRVSIVLDKASTIGAGYSTVNIAKNASAMAYRAGLRDDQASVTSKVEAAIGSKLDVKWNLTLAANIISANVQYGQIEAIKAVEGVKDVFLENRYEPDAVEAADEPNNGSSSYMIGATYTWANGYYGAGSKVAIIDTGVMVDHQSFDPEAYEYALAQSAEAAGLSVEDYVATLDLLTQEGLAELAGQLNSGASASQAYINSKIPYGYCYVDNDYDVTHNNDTSGDHGSHVSGIATANRFIKVDEEFVPALEAVGTQGVAPDAQLLVMKVFGNGGGAYDSDYMVAIEDAIILGCDSANLSLGSGNPGLSFSAGYEEIMNELVESDTVVTMSAGNSYAWYETPYNGAMHGYLLASDVSHDTTGSPASFNNSLAVASVDNQGSTGKPLYFGDLHVFYSETDYEQDPITSLANVENLEYIFFDNFGADADGNSLLADYADAIAGKVVLCSRGTSSFYQKVNAAAEAGAIGCVIYNNQPGTINMNLSGITTTIPAVAISQADGQAIRAQSEAVLNAETGEALYYVGTMSVGENVEVQIPEVSDTVTISSFSSWGVPGSLVLKPEILAPGGNIYSVYGYGYESGSWVGGADQYVSFSGTSMASPQVAGMAAIMGQFIRENNLTEKTGLTVRQLTNSLLMSTAHPVFDSYGDYHPVIRVGAGLANVGDATRATTYITMDETATMFPDSAMDGKVKAELGDDPDYCGEYEYSFYVNPIEPGAVVTFHTDIFTQWLAGNGGYGMLQDYSTVLLGAEVTYEVNGEILEPAYDGDSDVNKDGVTNADDAQAILDYLTGELAEGAPFNAYNADVDNDGEITTIDARKLLAGAVTPTVTIDESTKVIVRIKLDQDDIDFLLTYFTNGFYVEGYTYIETLSDEEGVEAPTHSIPILGYCGNWTDASMMDISSAIDAAYGTGAKETYLDNENTNYMTTKNANGSAVYMGNPYMVEEFFPADRLALNGTDTIQSFTYSLIRNAGTLGFAVMDEDGNVVYSQVGSSSALGAFYYVNGGAWYNASPRTYSVNKSLASLGFEEGDEVTVAFYALPEYYTILNAKANGEVATSSTLDNEAFKAVVESGLVGEGASIKYTVTLDNTDPELLGAYRDLITGNVIVKAQDNAYIAYIGVTNKAGTKEFAALVPEQSEAGEEVEVTLDLEGVSMPSEVLLVVGDYAGNEVAYKVNLGGSDQVEGGQMLGFVGANTTAAPGSGNRVWEILKDELWYNDDTGEYGGLSVAANLDFKVTAAEYVDGYVFMAGDDGWFYVAELNALDEAIAVGLHTNNIRDMAFNYADGNMYTLDDANNVYVMDLLTGEQLKVAHVNLPGASDGSANRLAIDDNGVFYTASTGGPSVATLYTFTVNYEPTAPVEPEDPEDPEESAYSWGFETEAEISTWTLVDADGDGYNWTWNQNISSWFSNSPDFDSFAAEGTGCLVSGSYINTVGVLSPDNWAISPAFDLTGATSATVSFMLKSVDSSYPEQVQVYAGTSTDTASLTAISSSITSPAEYQQFTADLSAFAGQSGVRVAFRNSGTYDMYLVDLDVVEILVANSPEVAPEVESRANKVEAAPAVSSQNVEPRNAIDFNAASDNRANLTNRTALTARSIEVDATRVGRTGASKAMAHEVKATDGAIYSWSFETDEELDGWEVYDVDGDGLAWYLTNSVAYDGEYCAFSESWDYDYGALSPDNYICTPAMDLSDLESATLSFWAESYSSYYPDEHFAVYATTDLDGDLTEILPETVSTAGWTNYTADLSDFAGEDEVYVLIRHFNCTDQSVFLVDMVEVLDGDAEPVEPDEPYEPAEGTVSWSFETAAEVASWTFSSENGVDWLWSPEHPVYVYSPYAHDGDAFIMAYSYVDYDGPYDADNWAISPIITLGEDSVLSFYATNANNEYPEPVSLYLYVGGQAILLDGDVEPTTSYDAWTHYEYDLSQYAGQNVCVAFHDENYDGYEFWLDLVEVTNAELVAPVEPIDGSVEWGFETADEVAAWTFARDVDASWVWSAEHPVYDYSEYAQDGEGFILSYSFLDGTGALQADNWAISPIITLGDGASLSFYATNGNSLYPELVSLYLVVSGSEDLVELDGHVEPTTSYDTWTHYEYDLSQYAGQNVCIAFHDECYDCYEFWLDSIEVTSAELLNVEPEPQPVDPEGDAFWGFETAAEVAAWTFTGTSDTNWLWSPDNPGGYDYTVLAHDGDCFILSYSFVDYVGAYQADNWAISPVMTLGEGSVLSFYATNANADYPEPVSLYLVVSGSEDMIELDGNVEPASGYDDDWTYYQYDLSNYAGQNVCVAFHDECYDCYEFWLDDVLVTNAEVIGAPEPIEPEPEPDDGEVDAETVGLMGVYNYSYAGSFAWDHDNDVLYLASNWNDNEDYDHYLWVVDTETGAASRANYNFGTGNTYTNMSARLYGAVSGLVIVPGGTTAVTPTDTATDLYVQPWSLNLLKGQNYKLKVSVLPWTLTNKDVTFESADPDIASVDANGVVTAKAPGETVITVTTVAEPNLTAEVSVSVELPPEAEIRAIIWSADGTPQASVFNTNAPADYTPEGDVAPLYWGVLVGDTIYGSDDETLYAIDADCYDVENLGGIAIDWVASDAEAVPQALVDAFAAMGYPNKVIAGLCYGGTFLELLDPVGGSLVYWDLTGEMSAPMATIAYVGMQDETTALYYIMLEDGTLLRTTMDSTGTLSWDEVGNTGIPAYGVSNIADTRASMTYDEESGFLFLALYDGNGDTASLYAIDPTDTNRAACLGDFGSDVWPVVGLYQYEPLTELALSVNPTELNLFEGDEANVRIKVKLGETNEFTVESSDETVAVYEDGVVKALSAGEAILTVTTVDTNEAGEHLSAEIAVNVRGLHSIEAFIQAQVTDENGKRFTEINLEDLTAAPEGIEAPFDGDTGARTGDIYMLASGGSIVALDAETFEPASYDFDEYYAYYPAMDIANYPNFVDSYGLFDTHKALFTTDVGWLVTPDYYGWDLSSYIPGMAGICFGGGAVNNETGNWNYFYLIIDTDGILYMLVVDPVNQSIDNLAAVMETGITVENQTNLSMAYLETLTEENVIEYAGIIIANNEDKGIYMIDLMNEEGPVVEKFGNLAADNVTGLVGSFDFVASVDVEPEPMPEPTDPGVYPEVNEEVQGITTVWDFETDPEAAGWTFVNRDQDRYNWIWTPGSDYSELEAYEGVGMIVSNSYVNNVGALHPDNFAISPAIDLSDVADANFAFYAKGQDPSWAGEVFAVYAGTSADLGEMVKISEDFTATGDWALYEASLVDFAGEEEVYVAIRHYNVTDMYILDVDYCMLLTAEGEPLPQPEAPIYGWYFEDEADLDGWQILDVNGDNRTFERYQTSSAYEGGWVLSNKWSTAPDSVDDYAITPAMDLSELLTARLSFAARSGSYSFSENMEVLIGTSDDPAEMEVLMPEETLANAWSLYSFDLSAYAGEEEVYLAFHHLNSVDQMYLWLDQVEVFGEGEEPEEPGAQSPEGGYFFSFEEEDALADWTIINANEDDNTFIVQNIGSSAYDGSNVLYNKWNTTESVDDYAITPALNLVSWGKSCEMSFYANSASNGLHQENLEVLIGTSNDPAEMEVLMEETAIPNAWTEYTLDLSAYGGEQEVYIAFHHLNSVDKFVLYIDAIAIDGEAPDPSPEDGYFFTFEDEDDPLEGFTVIDANEDGNTFHVMDRGIHAWDGTHILTSYYDSYDGMDEYAVSPALNLTSWTNPELVFYGRSQDPNYLESMTVLVGTSSDPAEMEVLMEETIVDACWHRYALDLSDYAGVDGVYVAFHHTSYDKFFLNLDAISINEHQDYEEYVAALPYENGFESWPELYGWTLLDANEDQNGFGMTSDASYEGERCMSAGYESYGMDDYLITPPLDLGDSLYPTVSFYARSDSAYYLETIEVLVGYSPDPDDMDVLMEATVVPADWTQYNLKLTDYVGTDRDEGEENHLYIAIHQITFDGWYLLIDSFSLHEGEPDPELVLDHQLTWSFETEEETAEWTLIDGNDDGCGWEHYAYGTYAFDGKKVLRSKYNSTNESDEYAVSPAFSLSGLYAAEASLWIKRGGSTLIDRFEVLAGTSADPEEMDVLLAFQDAPQEWTEFVVDLSDYVGEDEVYLCIHHGDCTNKLYLYLDYVQVSGYVPVSEPEEPQEAGLALPYFEGFEEEDCLDDWNIINANDDGYTWERYNSYSYEGAYDLSDRWNNSMMSDDYAITPALDLTTASNPVLSFYAESGSSYYLDTMEVLIGTSDDPAEMEVLMEATEFPNVYQEYTFDLSDYADETCVYIAFHHCNCQDKFRICVDNVSVSDGEAEVASVVDNTMKIPGAETATRRSSSTALSRMNTATATLGDGTGRLSSSAHLSYSVSAEMFKLGQTTNDVVGGTNAVHAEVVREDLRLTEDSTTISDGNVKIELTEDIAVTNGLYTITYNADALTFDSAVSAIALNSIHHEIQEPAEGDEPALRLGVITFAFATTEEIPAGTLLLALNFTYESRGLDTTVVVAPMERNDELEIDESLVITLFVDPGHICPCEDFVDMPEYGTPEHEAIDWAYTNGITAGMDATHFGTGDILTRAQTATFLYAAAGRPEFDETAAENPFSDVPDNKWYTKPVLWAASEGLVAGYTDGTFRPGVSLTRGQILVILYAWADKPDVSEIENPYSDVPADKWFTNAAIWAYAEGIEQGENGIFAQDTPCTRETFVLYLYRYMTGNCLLGQDEG